MVAARWNPFEGGRSPYDAYTMKQILALKFSDWD